MSVPITNCHILVQLAAVAGGIKASVKAQAASRDICTHAPRPNLNLRFSNVSESHSPGCFCGAPRELRLLAFRKHSFPQPGEISSSLSLSG